MTVKNILQKKITLKIAAILVIIIAFFFIFNIFSHRGTNRRTFTFPVSGSKWNKTEVRYLASDPVQGKIACYVDELVLGPSFYRGRPLFTPGTKVDYCFLQGKTLFVGLSEEAALQEGGALSIEKSIALFKKNIRKNFPSVKEIEIFIEGNFIHY